jgi:hypothetical protein
MMKTPPREAQTAVAKTGFNILNSGLKRLTYAMSFLGMIIPASGFDKRKIVR